MKKRLTKLVSRYELYAACMLVLLAGCPPEPNVPAVYLISGTVTNALTAGPLEAAVIVESEDGVIFRVAATRAEGKFELSVDSAGLYFVQVVRRSFVTFEEVIELTEDHQHEIIDVEMVRPEPAE